MKGILNYLVAVLCLSCGPTKDNDSTTQTVDSIQFPLINPKILTSQSDSLVVLQLDSVMRTMWSDKIMGRQIYYSSGYLAKFNKVNDHSVFAIQTSADDWGKTFLITTNSKLDLVDFMDITDSYGDAAEEDNGTQTVTGIEARTSFINDSTFIRTRIHEKIYSYGQSNESTEKDSINEVFAITTQGKFKLIKSDSIRTVE